MYSVLIVDDERWVVESLRKGIEWEILGFRVIETASDGDEALRKISIVHPDLVFTDIRMPVLNGLELIQRAQSAPNPPLFVVVSGYAEFAYAQKALQYGALGYCLKPVEPAEIGRTLERASGVLAARNHSDSGTESQIDDLDDAACAGDPNMERRVIAHDGAVIPDTLEGCGHRSAGIGPGVRLWILSEEEYRKIGARLDGEATSRDLFIGTSRPFRDRAALHAAVRDALVFSFSGFMGDHAGVHGDRNIDPELMRDRIRAVEQAIDAGNANTILLAFDSLRSVITDNGYTVKHAAFVYNAVMYFCDAVGDLPFLHYEDLMELFHSVGEMMTFLRDFAVGHIQAGVPCPAEQGPSVGRTVVEYVDGHFVASLSLEELSRHFGISAGHLCRLFKQQTGMPLTSYVAEKRINYACELLRTTGMAVGEIAEESGYDNYFYFARVFRKLRQLTPSEYRRESHGGERRPRGTGE